MDKKKLRRRFYPIFAATFYVFFHLHWNGMLSSTYYWLLEKTNTTHQFLPQVTAAFISSVVLFGAIALVFEVVISIKNQAKTR